MLDLLFIAIITGFFLLALAYIAGCNGSILAAICSVLLLIYLVYALLRPEKF